MSTAYVAAFLLHVHAVNPSGPARVTEALLQLTLEDVERLRQGKTRLEALQQITASLKAMVYGVFPKGLILVDDDEDTQAASAAADVVAGSGRDCVRLTKEHARRLAEYGDIPGVMPELPRVIVDEDGVVFTFQDPALSGRYETKNLPWEEIEKIR